MSIEKEYDEKYYNDIWHSILSKYTTTSPVYDLGDLSRQFYVSFFLKEFLCRSNFAHVVSIIDFGAGNWLYLGEILRVIAEFDPQQKYLFHIIGVDYSEKALNFGIQKYADQIPQNVTVFQRAGDIVQIVKEIDTESCDLVISLETLEHLYDHETLIAHTSRILKKNGRGIFSTPNKYPALFSKNWFTYVFLKKRFSEKDKAVGHLRRYAEEDHRQLAAKYGLSIRQSQCYGFVFSDYLKMLSSFVEKHSKRLFVRIFPLLYQAVLRENILCNKLHIKRSEGIFVFLSREDNHEL